MSLLVGVGAGRDDWMLLKLAAVVLFSVALAVELTYFIFLRHTGYYEGAWRSDPATAEVVRRNQQLNVGVSVEVGSGGGGGGGQYGATLGLDAPGKEEEMYTVLPRFPAFFKTWNDYEAVAIMIWIGKDFSWMVCTKFGKDHHLMEASKVAWLTCTCLVFAIHFDFFLTSINTKDTVEWVTYLSMLLWACSQTLWAGGEIFLHESVIKRENVLKEPENYNNLRWYAGWFALLSLMVLYSFWFGKTVASITADCHATHKEEGEDGDIRM